MGRVSSGDVLKRLALGRPLRSQALGEQELSKKIALPVFASDALSSVAYATEEILLVLSAGGFAFYHYTWGIAACVGLLMVVVVLSYRKNVHAYPSGGGDFEVATTNLGARAGMVVAAALMVDYVLTVAVSVSAGVANLTSAVTSLQGHAVAVSLAIVAVITLLNLRGLREAGSAFAVPTYAFVVGVVGLLLSGLFKFVFSSHHPRAESASYSVHAAHYTGFALIFLLLRAFASGCTALTGVEAISNGVPSFKKPKSKNAATTLALLGCIAVSLFVGVTALALATHVHVAPDGVKLNGAPANYVPKTVLAQIGASIFGAHSIFFYYVQGVTALILVLAANTAFNGFPVLASILAQHSFVPRQLRTRGDRLIYSNGVILLAAFAMLLIVAFSASPTKLIQLYIIGVFVSFVESQTGMIRHWNRLLRRGGDASEIRVWKRSRIINRVGAVFTAIVLVIVLVTKFAKGAWIVVVTMPILYLLMAAVHKHYARVATELEPEPDQVPVLPSRVHAVVLVSKIHRPTLRALAYAKATHPHTLEAITVAADPEEAKELEATWHDKGLADRIPLRVLASPYRDVTDPLIDYVASIRRQSPRDLVVVYIPEYVVGHWWEQLLHNQTPLRIKARLLYQPGVMVTSVPYQLRSSSEKTPEGLVSPREAARLEANTTGDGATKKIPGEPKTDAVADETGAPGLEVTPRSGP
jgi:amino acid transporter